MTDTARVKIGKIRLKNGGEVQVLYPEINMQRRSFELMVRQMLDNIDETEWGGFAVVMWERNGSSITRLGVLEDNIIPTAMIPDFVRNLLLAEFIENWTLETVTDDFG